MLDLVVRNGLIVRSTEQYRADIGVRDESIVTIGHDLAKGHREIDATGLYVLPGAIDGHVHMRAERDEWAYDDNFEHGSIAGAFGGCTTMIDFAQVEPGLTLWEGLEKRKAEAIGRSVIDYGLHVNPREALPERLQEIPSLIAQGFPSVKLYMNYDTFQVPDDFIFRCMQVIAEHNGLAIIHAENRTIIDELDRQNQRAGMTTRLDNARARPAVMEGEATHRVLAMASVTGARTLIFHMTSLEGVRELRGFRDRGQAVYGEVCPQYLLLDERDVEDPVRGTALDISPPLRTEEHREALWAALADGGVDIVSSDHGPRRMAHHEDGSRYVPKGTSGIETRLALMHEAGVNSGRLTLGQWVAACSTRPAAVFGLAGKGDILPGYDADLVLFDPHAEVELSPDTLHSNIDHATYDGMSVRGYPVVTVSRGAVIVEDGKFVGEVGRGRLLARSYG